MTNIEIFIYTILILVLICWFFVVVLILRSIWDE